MHTSENYIKMANESYDDEPISYPDMSRCEEEEECSDSCSSDDDELTRSIMRIKQERGENSSNQRVLRLPSEVHNQVVVPSLRSSASSEFVSLKSEFKLHREFNLNFLKIESKDVKWPDSYCKGCKTRIYSTDTRLLRKHLEDSTCAASDEIKEKILKGLRKQQKTTNVVQREYKELKLQLSKVMISNNIPMRAVEDRHFHKLLNNDVILYSSSIHGMTRQQATASPWCAARGMRINPKKSTVLHLRRVAHEKRVVMSQDDMSIEREKIPMVSDSFERVLGVHMKFTGQVDHKADDFARDLDLVCNSKLRPSQKIAMIRECLIPMIKFRLVYGFANKVKLA